MAQARTVRKLIGLAGQFAAVDELLTGFDLDDTADRQVRTYSGGMRRRLDLASSLITRPGMLFLDEPTTELDPRSRDQIWGNRARAGGRRHHPAADHPVPGGGRPRLPRAVRRRLQPAPGRQARQPSADLPAGRDDVGLVADAARALQQAGVTVADLALRRPTLDDVFLRLAGAEVTETTATATTEDRA